MTPGTIDNKRADRLNYLLASCHREVIDEPNLGTLEKGDLGKLIDAAKDEVNRRRDCTVAEGA